MAILIIAGIVIAVFCDVRFVCFYVICHHQRAAVARILCGSIANPLFCPGNGTAFATIHRNGNFAASLYNPSNSNLAKAGNIG